LPVRCGQRRAALEDFFFSAKNKKTERLYIAEKIRTILGAMSPRLQIRSIRRGGLTMMAEAGIPLEDNRSNFSKHSSPAMLMTYLNAGAVSAHQAQQQIDAVRQADGRIGLSD
jgi:hypothetical protein